MWELDCKSGHGKMVYANGNVYEVRGPPELRDRSQTAELGAGREGGGAGGESKGAPRRRRNRPASRGWGRIEEAPVADGISRVPRDTRAAGGQAGSGGGSRGVSSQ